MALRLPLVQIALTPDREIQSDPFVQGISNAGQHPATTLLLGQASAGRFVLERFPRLPDCQTRTQNLLNVTWTPSALSTQKLLARMSGLRLCILVCHLFTP